MLVLKLKILKIKQMKKDFQQKDISVQIPFKVIIEIIPIVLFSYFFVYNIGKSK